MLREVSAALDQHLASMPNLPPVAWPNVNFTPPSSLYLSVKNNPAEGVLYNMGRSQNTPGIYMVNVFSPVNIGPAQAEQTADDISEHFRNNSTPIKGLFIEEINYDTSAVIDAYFLLPLNINWRYFSSHA